MASPHQSAGDRVDRSQGRDVVAAQHAAHGGGDQAELSGQEHRSATAGPAQRQDGCFDLGRGAGRAVVRATRAIGQPGPSFLAVAM
jgi:hypothetical protein